MRQDPLQTPTAVPPAAAAPVASAAGLTLTLPLSLSPRSREGMDGRIERRPRAFGPDAMRAAVLPAEPEVGVFSLR